jgi:hypothetical protein
VKTYKLKMKPYTELLLMLKSEKAELVTFESDASHICHIDNRFAYYFSKATGLKSNKKRAIKKRFQQNFWKMILENIEKAELT